MSDNSSKALLVVLGNQLFPVEYLDGVDCAGVFMAEDLGLCTDVRHHQQKIVLFLAAMRHYADTLRRNGFTVHYRELDPSDKRPYEEKLDDSIVATGCDAIVHFEIEDKPMEQRIATYAEGAGLRRVALRSPMFLCSRERFRDYSQGKETLRMAEFYKQERRRLFRFTDSD